MIHYALTCDQAHEFESWFPSVVSFEEQQEKGLLICPVCGSSRVDRQVMAPSVVSSSGTDVISKDQSEKPVSLLSEKEQKIREVFREFREHIQKNSEHVGERFPEEARKMHYGEVEYRSIYGETSFEEARSLVEEGIDVMPLPRMPHDGN